MNRNLIENNGLKVIFRFKPVLIFYYIIMKPFKNIEFLIFFVKARLKHSSEKIFIILCKSLNF